MNMQDGYPFVFTKNDRSEKSDVLEYTLQYRFKSTKSNHTYIVRVEKYIEHTYCLKFFDKANMLSENKFSARSNTYEVRTILYTLQHIMLDVLGKDSNASFFFIGARDEKDELGESTRRYRIYRKFVSSTVSEQVFEHYRFNELSLYILVNRSYGENRQEYANKILEKVKEAYSLANTDH